MSVLLAACGSSSSDRPDSAGDQLAVVSSTCEANGGSSLLPRQDTSSVRDSAPIICRCWVDWIRHNLASGDQAALATGVILSASAMSLTNSLLERLARALRACEARHPSATKGAAPEPPTSSPGP
jgi:hypothetical protein